MYIVNVHGVSVIDKSERSVFTNINAHHSDDKSASRCNIPLATQCPQPAHDSIITSLKERFHEHRGAVREILKGIVRGKVVTYSGLAKENAEHCKCQGGPIST